MRIIIFQALITIFIKRKRALANQRLPTLRAYFKRHRNCQRSISNLLKETVSNDSSSSGSDSSSSDGSNSIVER